jgi:ATP-dependent Lon protease
MVSTRSKSTKVSVNDTTLNDVYPSSDDDSDLDYIDNDIDAYNQDDSESDSEITHSNNISIDTNLSNKPITRNSIKRKRIVESESEDDLNESEDDLNESEDDLNESEDDLNESEDDLNEYTQVISGIVDKICGITTENGKNTKINISEKWKKNFTKSQVKKYDGEYKLISEKISVEPTINDILQFNMPFDVKCDLMEKLIILNNTQVETFDHLNISKSILQVIDKYKKFNLIDVDYKKFDKIENKLKSDNTNDIPLNFKILNSNMNYKNKLVVYSTYSYYKTLIDNSNESSKLLNWIESVLKLPTELLPLNVSVENKLNYKTNTISKFLSDVNYKLNAEIYGMDNVKEQILCVLNNKITNPKMIGSSIGLVGPQGVGKTQIIKILSNAIKLPFESISLGGMSDSDHLLGHGYTYEGSRCGAIAESLMNMKYLNGILFFDEIDKISTTKAGTEITKSLIHITDFTQNNEFCDKYLGNSIKIDLSNLWFIYSLNYKELIDRTLLDRLTLIDVSGYTINEKKEMSIKYLIPSVLKNIGLKKKNCISFSDDALLLIIKNTNEMYDESTRDKSGNSGVRKLKECIISIITKINYINNIIKKDGTYGDLKPSFALKNFKLPYVIKVNDIEVLKIFTKKTSDVNYDMYI